MTIKDINDKTPEGRLLMMALAALTVSPQIQVDGESLDGRQSTPDAMLNRIKNVADKVYTDQPVDEFEAACRPLMKYMAEHHHPHVAAIVTNTHGELFEGLKSTAQITEYIKD